MSDFLDRLAARRRFGMRPSLDAIRGTCAALGDPQLKFRAIHVAGTNGKGAVCAMLDAALRAGGLGIGRYTSPHLVRINERFFLGGEPISDEMLESASSRVDAAIKQSKQSNNQTISNLADLTFFEALTAVAFLVYAEAKVDFAVLETGLGGRLDATNVCRPELCVITRIGLDHCDWLGDTVEKIAAEKAGIIKPGVPVVLGRNGRSVIEVVKAKADEVGAPFVYAPDVADESEIPAGYSLAGSFNRENAVTAIAALKTLGLTQGIAEGFGNVVWPGRFQRVGRFIVDGAHNPPAARALAAALREYAPFAGSVPTLIAGFCGDKDVDETLRILAPLVKKGIAVRTNNPRSLAPCELAKKMESAGISAISCDSIRLALRKMGSVPNATGSVPTKTGSVGGDATVDTLICGSLFLAGEALAELGAFPWTADRFDAAEILKV